jgi:hypothetical protein
MIALQIGVGSVDREALLGWALPHVSGQ